MQHIRQWLSTHFCTIYFCIGGAVAFSFLQSKVAILLVLAGLIILYGIGAVIAALMQGARQGFQEHHAGMTDEQKEIWDAHMREHYPTRVHRFFLYASMLEELRREAKVDRSS